MGEFVEHVEMEGGLAVTTWDDDAPIIGFQVDAFNWRLRRAREAKDWSRSELARQCGIAPTVVGNAEKLRRVSDAAREKMALALGIPEDVLFPGEIDALPKDGPAQIELSMTREDVRSLAEPDANLEMIEGAERAALKGLVADAMGALSPRQQRVLRLRFGLDDGQPRTLHEVGHQFGVQPERVRQIEAQALRQLRGSRSRKHLSAYLPEHEYSYEPKPNPKECQRIQDGDVCQTRVPPPGWMFYVAVDDLKQPMFWCDVCWARFLSMRSLIEAAS